MPVPVPAMGAATTPVPAAGGIVHDGEPPITPLPAVAGGGWYITGPGGSGHAHTPNTPFAAQVIRPPVIAPGHAHTCFVLGTHG